MNAARKTATPWRIAQALLADMGRRGWVWLTLGFLGALSLPVLVLWALQARGALIVDDPAMIILHFTFAQVMGMCFGATVLHAAGAPARLYALPLSNRSITLFQMVPATLLVIGQTMASTWILNQLFGLDWPLPGNALAFGMAFATFQSLMTLFQKSALMLPVLGSALALESLWIKGHHGPLFSLPTQYWTTVTVADWVVVGVVLALFYAIGLHAIARARQGNEIRTKLLDYLSTTLANLFGRKSVVFQNAMQAQSWYEWNLKGLIFPIIVALIVPITVFFWCLTDNRLTDLLEALRVEGWMMSAAAMIGGLILGNMGLTDASMTMSPFLGTKPLATVPWSRILLGVAFRSLVLGVAVWAGVYLLIWWVRELSGENHGSEPFIWWHIPGRLLAAWTAMTFALCLSLTGRLIHLKILGGVYCGWLVLAILVGNLTPGWVAEWFTLCSLSACGMGLFLLTLGVWGLAIKKRMLGGGEAMVASLVVVALVGIALWQLATGISIPGGVRIHHYFLISGVLSLVVFPFAGAPLALAWNRTR